MTYLATLSPAYTGPTAGIVTLEYYPILVSLFIWSKTYAGLIVIFLECSEYGHHLGIIWKGFIRDFVKQSIFISIKKWKYLIKAGRLVMSFLPNPDFLIQNISIDNDISILFIPSP